ncbi:acetylglutamate/acetylaminoadipate kinase [Halobacterium sp. CBA1126]|uniref:acetylglutamate/acetylaminoadipate kinase n=1 Tax=Halobacterium sp. CBA1126 TaxID=2668074 RepID=UPI0012F92998|nr:acetylglutamate/acetylaminoadipate kinase [Halobacterium sp. CBA1126]MUV59920.1 acetylglutamate/acetylaminoadipate kinase [Halobacterium sp. CBA1126]
MTVVVKIGGARAVDPAGAVTDVAHLTVNDEDVVVVHGGSTAVDDALDRMGKEPDYVESPSGVTGRFTDAETMEIFEMAMGKVNTDLVAAFENAGVPAVGLNGVDGKLLSGPRKSAVRVVEDGKKKIRRGEHSGTIEDVNTDLLAAQLDAGYVPVVSVPMFARESEDGEEWTPVNADADRAAAAVAGALDATLVVLTDVEGVYADPDDPESLIEEVLTPEDLDGAKDAAEGFMTKKVLAATEALEGGAESVVVSDANRRDPIVAALEGAGTRFSPEALP